MTTGTWSRTPPAVQGRYWWRAPDRFKRPGIEHMSYGLMLVQWVQYGEFAPNLRVVSLSTFNRDSGGEMSLPGGNWSYGSGHEPREFDAHHPGVEFWSEPERGPGGFLPELPGRPDWTAPDPAVVEAARKKSAAESAKREKEEVDERAKRIADAKESGSLLYECGTCEEVYDEDDLVQVRECTHCDEKFDGTSNGHNCPSCSRPFTKNITEQGCPECLEEEPCELLAEFLKPPEPEPMTKPKKKKRR